MWCKVLLACIATLGFVAAASATPVINGGTHTLAPNTSGQTVQVNVTGSDAVAGLNFFVAVGDGTAGPKITAVDLVGGTAFATNNFGGNLDLSSGTNTAWKQAWGVLTNSGTVNASGLVATLTIDTTGLTSGSWALAMNVPNWGTTSYNNSSGQNISTTLNAGTLTIPEPATMTLLALGGLALLRRRTRSA